VKYLIRQLIFKYINPKFINNFRSLKWLILKPFINYKGQIKKFYESEIDLQILEQIISEFKFDQNSNPTFIDCGANIGGYSYYLSNFIVKYGGICVGFEPRKDTWSQLVKNVIADNFTAENLALSNTTGDAQFFLPASHGRSSFVKLPEFEGVPTTSVNKITLDQYITEKKLNSIFFIKIDVEGHEFEVLEGALKTIHENLPIILCESENRHLNVQGKSTEELIGRLRQLDYNAYVVSRSDFQFIPVENIMIPLQKNNQKEYLYNYWFVSNKSTGLIIPIIEKFLNAKRSELK
jgi:FkbM family methyltransferase